MTTISVSPEVEKVESANPTWRIQHEEQAMELSSKTRHAAPMLRRMWRRFGLLALALALAMGAVLPASAAPVPPQNCTTMLQPTFAWAQQGTVNTGPTEVVYATVTDHTTQDLVRLPAPEDGNIGQDQVYFATGMLSPVSQSGQKLLQGSLDIYSNKVASVGTTQPIIRMGTAN